MERKLSRINIIRTSFLFFLVNYFVSRPPVYIHLLLINADHVVVLYYTCVCVSFSADTGIMNRPKNVVSGNETDPSFTLTLLIVLLALYTCHIVFRHHADVVKSILIDEQLH